MTRLDRVWPPPYVSRNTTTINTTDAEADQNNVIFNNIRVYFIMFFVTSLYIIYNIYNWILYININNPWITVYYMIRVSLQVLQVFYWSWETCPLPQRFPSLRKAPKSTLSSPKREGRRNGRISEKEDVQKNHMCSKETSLLELISYI